MYWIDRIKLMKNNFIMEEKDYEYFYETSSYINDKSIYKEKFIKTNNLPKTQDYKLFNEYIIKSKNKYATSFYNLSKSTKLVIPMPRKNKNFSTLNNFCKNASKTHQQQFWKLVSNEIVKYKKNNKKVFISTHGLGVPYLHIRIESNPKYYISNLKKS